MGMTIDLGTAWRTFRPGEPAGVRRPSPDTSASYTNMLRRARPGPAVMFVVAADGARPQSEAPGRRGRLGVRHGPAGHITAPTWPTRRPPPASRAEIARTSLRSGRGEFPVRRGDRRSLVTSRPPSSDWRPPRDPRSNGHGPAPAPVRCGDRRSFTIKWARACRHRHRAAGTVRTAGATAAPSGGRAGAPASRALGEPRRRSRRRPGRAQLRGIPTTFRARHGPHETGAGP